MIVWKTKTYDELTKEELYAILQLRSDVFVVEQDCVYLDIDGKDSQCWHLFAEENGRLIACMRVLPLGVESETEGSIGRIIVAKDYRGTGLGHELVARGIALYNDVVGRERPIVIHAQSQLENFYGQHGFKAISEPYMFEGLLHTNMILQQDVAEEVCGKAEKDGLETEKLSQENSAESWRTILQERGLTVSTAESCTSGRIAAEITSVSGASNYFLSGLVAYQDEVKEEKLGVAREMIERFGVVSQPVVEEMVRGACRLFTSDFALASTGYAEAWEGHDVEIWIGWGSADDVHSLCLRNDHGRIGNVEEAARRAIEEFGDYLFRKECLREMEKSRIRKL